MFGRDAQRKMMEQLRQEFAVDLLETEKKISAVFSYAEDRLTQGLSRAGNRSAADLSDMKNALAEAIAETGEKISSLLSDAEEKLSLHLSATEEKIIAGFPDATAQWNALLAEAETRLKSAFSNTEAKIDARLREAEERLLAEFPAIEPRMAELLSKTEEKLSTELTATKTDIAARIPIMGTHAAGTNEESTRSEKESAALLFEAGEKMAAELSGVEKKLTDHLAAVEERLISKLAGTEEKMAADLSAIEEKSAQRNVALAEQLHQIRQRDDAPQSHLETLLKSQVQILETLSRMEKARPLEALMNFAGKFALTQPGMTQPGRKDDAARALAGQFDDLLSSFGLTLVTDLGEPFAPSRHVISRTRHDPAWPEDIVLEVTEPGFLMGKKILRPAAVVVNRPSSVEQDERSPLKESPFVERRSDDDLPVKIIEPREENRKKSNTASPQGVKGFLMWLFFGVREPASKSGRYDADRKRKRHP